MRFFCVSFFLLVSLVGFSQEFEIPLSRAEKIVKGDSITCFEVLYEGSCEDVDNSKYYYWFSEGRIHVNQGGYSGYLLDGLYKIYGTEGKLLEQGSFDCGLKNGVWKKWNAEGKLVSEQNWERGLKHGKQTFFSQAGVVRVLQYKRGKIDGKEKRFKNGKELKASKIRKPKKVKAAKSKAKAKGGRKFFSFGKKKEPAYDKKKQIVKIKQKAE